MKVSDSQLKEIEAEALRIYSPDTSDDPNQKNYYDRNLGKRQAYIKGYLSAKYDDEALKERVKILETWILEGPKPPK